MLKSSAQYKWKPERDEDGIRIFSSDINDAKYKAVKVECTFKGTYDKLIAVLSNVTHNAEWVYNSKKNIVLKKNHSQDFIYYTETNFPWPLSNRDAVIHFNINTDSLPKFLTISGVGEPKLVPEMFDKVRVPHYAAKWKITMPTSQTLSISYVLEADPGGSVPSWLANLFVDKGPFETFKNLRQKLIN